MLCNDFDPLSLGFIDLAIKVVCVGFKASDNEGRMTAREVIYRKKKPASSKSTLITTAKKIIEA